ncbi:hypothetical protein RhiirA4_431656 [Rhizophagus irregularis]|uniref:Uncharacterized protein n=1 Tax=Rhizophagus irregularis TaxID=588596 RepID=A0A2I1HQR4_9GLOM|nr:hypothetical protein RhiirA4_431656 [Rhizophagus irregularis]
MNVPMMMMIHQQRIGGYLKKYLNCMQSVYTVVTTEIAHLREDNEFLAGVNAEFGSENDDLKEEVNELKMKLKQYQIRSSSESIDVIDIPEERLVQIRWVKKGKKTVHYTKNQPKEEQEEQHEKEARVCNFVILGRIVQSLYFYTNYSDLKIEMKIILKTIKPNDNLDDNETFNSSKNVEICSRLIPKLQRMMFPNYRPSVAKLTNWLSALHKSQRSQTQLKKSGKSNKDNRRVHNNSCVQNVNR